MYGVARAELTYAFVVSATSGTGPTAPFDTSRMHSAHTASQGSTATRTSWRSSCALHGSTPVDEAIRLCENAISRHPDRLRDPPVPPLPPRRSPGAARRPRRCSRRPRQALAPSWWTLERTVGLRTSAAGLLGSVEALAGDWQRAEEIFRPAFEYARQQPSHRMWQGYFLARLAEAALGRGDPGAAVALAEETRAVCVAGDLVTEIWSRRVAGRALAATDHPRKGMTMAREAVAYADTSDDLVQKGESRLDLAEVYVRAGYRKRAAQVAGEGLALLDRKGALLLSANGRRRFADLVAESRCRGRGERRAPDAWLAHRRAQVMHRHRAARLLPARSSEPSPPP